jgi:hypothetical protein
MFHDDDSMFAEGEELRARADDGLEESLLQIGVHVTGKSLAAVEIGGTPMRPAVVITATLGQLAFTERVLDPEGERKRAEIDEQFESIAEGIVDADFERHHQELLGDLHDDEHGEHGLDCE